MEAVRGRVEALAMRLDEVEAALPKKLQVRKCVRS